MMIIKTNMNRNQIFHDNIHYEPIEVQLLNLILSTKLFSRVEYRCDGNGRYFILNGDKNNILPFSIETYRVKLFILSNDKYGLCRGNKPLENELEYNTDISAQLKKCLKFVILTILATNKCDNFINERIPNFTETENLVTSAVNEHFISKFKFKFKLYNESILCKDNEYTDGVWSWCNFNYDNLKNGDFGALIELYNDGTFSASGIDNFVSDIQKKLLGIDLSISELSIILTELSDLVEKFKNFNGNKIPYMKEMLETFREGYILRKELVESFK